MNLCMGPSGILFERDIILLIIKLEYSQVMN